MEIGVFTISSSLIVLMAAGAIGWALLRVRYLPRAKAQLQKARGSEIPIASTHLALMKSLSFLSLSLFACPILVAAVCAYAQWKIDTGAQDVAKVQSVLETRELLESIVQPLTSISLQVWIIGVTFLAVIWVVASRSASRRSWNRALSARRSAHLASISSKPDSELYAEASQVDPSAVQRVHSEASRIEEQNRERIRRTETARMFALEGEHDQKWPVSIVELREVVANLEARAASLENSTANSQAGPYSETPQSAV